MSLIHFTLEEDVEGDIQVETGRNKRFDWPDQTTHLPVSGDTASIDPRAARHPALRPIAAEGRLGSTIMTCAPKLFACSTLLSVEAEST